MKRIALTAAAFVVFFACASYATDGVVEINQARALAGGVTPGDTPGFPVTIIQAGSYRLTGSLTPGAGVDGILVAADDVSIDLNGFSILGPRFGIDGRTHTNTSVANGSVLSVTGEGIALGASGRVERVRITGASGSQYGIHADADVIVSGCSISGIQFFAIRAFSGLITGNIVSSNVVGVQVNGLVTANRISGNSSYGLALLGGGYSGNVFAGNQGGGASGHVFAYGADPTSLQLGPNMCDGAVCP